MKLKNIEEAYREYLDRLPLPSIRILARRVGVAQCSIGKSQLIENIIEILTERAQPAPRSNRGAPVKQNYLDPEILDQLEKIKSIYREGNTMEVSERRAPAPEEEVYFKVSSPDERSGILELMPSGYGFLRAKNCQPTGSDVFLPAPIIHNLKLREGDNIVCTVKPKDRPVEGGYVKNDSAAIDKVLRVNGFGVEMCSERALFDNLTACYPNKRINLSEKNGELSLRLLDLFVPIGKGQRALIIAPPKAGKTTLLKNIARSIADHHKDLVLIVLLIDERPEEVTDFSTSVEGAQVVYSTFDEGADHHIRAAELTIAHAKRLAELGKDVVILLDSLTKLTRAYNYVAESTGKVLSGGLDATALAAPKQFFGAARNTQASGSITILATALVDTGSRMDDVIYEEFKGTGNADIFLSRELAERRIFPAIDLRRSGTRKEELLLPREALNGVYKLRERNLTDSTEGILEMMKKTDTNEEFISRVGEWLKIYKSK